MVTLACPSCNALNRVDPTRLDQAVCGVCKATITATKPIDITAATFRTQVERSGLPVLVDFWSPTCGPCRMMSPQFDEAAGLLAPNVRLGKVNVSVEQGLASHFRTMSVPTMILFQNGQERDRISGAMNSGQIVQWVQSRL